MFNYQQYSDDQLDYLDELCRYRRSKLPKTNYSSRQWLAMDPELQTLFTTLLKEKEFELEELELSIIKKFDHYNRLPMPYSLMGNELVTLIQGDKAVKLNKDIRWFKMAFTEFSSDRELTADQIESARQFPMVDLMTTEGHRGSYNCPFHDDSTPSFHIFPNNSWHCFGCQKHGSNAIDYVMLKDDLTFPNAVKSLIGV